MNDYTYRCPVIIEFVVVRAHKALLLFDVVVIWKVVLRGHGSI
jgi:hypothetical protein